jgi:hypothetical protein
MQTNVGVLKNTEVELLNLANSDEKNRENLLSLFILLTSIFPTPNHIYTFKLNYKG